MRKGLFALRLQDLLAAIHAALQVHMMGTVKLARIRVLDIGRLRQRIGRTAHAALRRGGFPLGDGHGLRSDCSASGPPEANPCPREKGFENRIMAVTGKCRTAFGGPYTVKPDGKSIWALYTSGYCGSCLDVGGYSQLGWRNILSSKLGTK